jgi:hypothetical protein
VFIRIDIHDLSITPIPESLNDDEDEIEIEVEEEENIDHSHDHDEDEDNEHADLVSTSKSQVTLNLNDIDYVSFVGCIAIIDNNQRLNLIVVFRCSIVD